VGNVMIVKPIKGGLAVWSELGRDAAMLVYDYGVTPSGYVAKGVYDGTTEVGTFTYNCTKPVAKGVGTVFLGIYGTIGMGAYYVGYGTSKVLSCLGGSVVKPIVHGSGAGLVYVGEGLVHLTEDERERLAAQRDLDIKANGSTGDSGGSWFPWFGLGGTPKEPEKKSSCLARMCPCCCGDKGDDYQRPPVPKYEDDGRHTESTTFTNYPSWSNGAHWDGAVPNHGEALNWAKSIPNHGDVVFNPTPLAGVHLNHANHSQIVFAPGENVSQAHGDGRLHLHSEERVVVVSGDALRPHWGTQKQL
jgi:hypothetical protein